MKNNYSIELKKLNEMRQNAKKITDFSNVSEWLAYNSEYAKQFANQVDKIRIAGIN